ncbi:MAG TPA: response regulator [Terriglobales bacterium]|nr:response regulator [Terriglobales bacterium]
MATILVVDDDPNARQLYISLLKPFGHTVLEARDGHAGLNLAREHKPDLIVSDILMPTMNGYDFVSALRKLPGHSGTNVIFQSASFLDRESRALGNTCGVSDYLSKPCDPEKILETVNRMLGLPAAPVPVVPRGGAQADPVSLLVDAFYHKGRQVDTASARLSALVTFGIQLSQLETCESLMEAAVDAARNMIGANYSGASMLAEATINGGPVELRCCRFAGMEDTLLIQCANAPVPSAFLRVLNGNSVVREFASGKVCKLGLPSAHPPVHSFLGMPIRTLQRKYGLIYVADKLGGAEFDAEDEALLTTVAARLAIGCENLAREQRLREQMLLLEREVGQRREAQDRFRLLVENSPMGILLCDNHGKITEANSQLQRMFGYNREEMIGKPVDMLVPESLRSLHSRHRHEYLMKPQTRPMGVGMELYGQRKDGATFPVEISLSPLRGADHPMISSTVVDITERKKLEEQLRISQRLEAVGGLAAGIAHDFNNILTAISGNVSLGLADLPAGHRVQQNLEEIAKAAARATKLVRQILSFSRQNAPKREPVNLASVVDEAVTLLRAGLRANISLDTDCASDLPAVLADSTQIHQVVMNLCTNAADAIGEKQGSIKIQIKEANPADAANVFNGGLRQESFLQLSVTDTGSGMDQQTLRRLFEPFYTTKPAGRGTGLGLSVVHGIVQQHGGAVRVQSAPGQGSRFNVYFPVTAGQVANEKRHPREEVRGKGERILYVDDEEPLVLLMTKMLERLGYEVSGCPGAHEALELFRKHPQHFDAVITDLSMPGMSGTDLAHEILQIRPGTPIIITSGYIRAEDNEAVRKLGLADIQLKPDTVQELAKTIQDLLTVRPGQPARASADSGPLAKTARAGN